MYRQWVRPTITSPHSIARPRPVRSHGPSLYTPYKKRQPPLTKKPRNFFVSCLENPSPFVYNRHGELSSSCIRSAMDATKIFSSMASLSNYCFDRYNVSLSKKILSEILALYSTSFPDDVSLWLKVSLTNLGCFPCGYSQPCEVNITTPLHMGWKLGYGEIIPSLCNDTKSLRQSYTISDRHRAGRQPGLSDDMFDGELSIIPVMRDER